MSDLDDLILPDESAASVYSQDGRILKSIDASKISPHNFRNPGFLSDADLRRLSMLHEKFVQRLSARLSTFLRMECVLKMTKFIGTTFERFLESTAKSTHITLFQVEPLRGVSLLELGLNAAFGVADRLLGGKGRVLDSDRQLTEIELTLLEDVSQLILSEWTQMWHDDEWVLTPQIIGRESSGRFIQTAAPEAVFVSMSVVLTLGDITDELQMGIPFSMIEPTLKKLQMSQPTGDRPIPRKMQWRVPYANIPVELTAEWPVREMELQEVLNLKIGDVIHLPRELVNHTRLCVSGKEEYVGTVGVQNGKVSVHITERAQNLN